MISNKDHTVIYNADELLKPFVDSSGHICVDEKCDPQLIVDLNKHKTTPNLFKLVLSDKKCPHCGSKLHVHDVVNFNLNNSLLMLKTVYKCSNDDCRKYCRPTWNEYIEPNCNYTHEMMENCIKIREIT